MRVRLTTEPDGRTCLESPYDRAFVDDLKQIILWDGRSWEPGRKRWLLSALYVEDLLDYCQRKQVQVLDEREGMQGESCQASPPPMPDDLRQAFDVLYLAYTAPIVVAEASYKALAKIFHSDRPDYGDAEKIVELNHAIATIRRYLVPPVVSYTDDDIPF